MLGHAEKCHRAYPGCSNLAVQRTESEPKLNIDLHEQSGAVLGSVSRVVVSISIVLIASVPLFAILRPEVFNQSTEASTPQGV